MTVIGRTQWAIAEGCIPETSTDPDPEAISHETVCLLNATEQGAHAEVTVYFSDRDPVCELRSVAERTRHVEFTDLDDPEPIPRGTDFASVLESDQPVVCQHTRLDSRQAENALLSAVPDAGGQ